MQELTVLQVPMVVKLLQLYTQLVSGLDTQLAVLQVVLASRHFSWQVVPANMQVGFVKQAAPVES
jgi:hypothetical protein